MTKEKPQKNISYWLPGKFSSLLMEEGSKKLLLIKLYTRISKELNTFFSLIAVADFQSLTTKVILS